MMGGYAGGPGWGGWLMMTVTMFAFWALLVLGGIAALRSLRREEAPGDASTDAQRLLDARFARGEIDAEEYTRRRELLRSGR